MLSTKFVWIVTLFFHVMFLKCCKMSCGLFTMTSSGNVSFLNLNNETFNGRHLHHSTKQSIFHKSTLFLTNQLEATNLS